MPNRQHFHALPLAREPSSRASSRPALRTTLSSHSILLPSLILTRAADEDHVPFLSPFAHRDTHYHHDAGHRAPRGHHHDDDPDLEHFTSSALYRLWRHRRGVVAAAAGLLVLLAGIALATVLFVWIRSVETANTHAEVHRRCGSLADSLKLDFNTNLGTYIIDYAAFMSTVGPMTNASLESYGRAASNQSSRLASVQLGPLIAPSDTDTYRRRFGLDPTKPPTEEASLKLTSIPITLRYRFTPTSLHFTFPAGFDMQIPDEYLASIQRAFATQRPVLALQDPPDSLIPGASERTYIFKSITHAADPDFPLWIQVAIVNSKAIFASDFDRALLGRDLSVQLHDTDTNVLLYSVASDSKPYGASAPVAIDIVDRVWSLSCTGTHALRGSFATPWPFVLLVTIVVLFLALAEIVRRGLHRLLTARSLAHRLEQQAMLVKAIRNYSTGILRAVRDPLLVLDAFGYIVGLNPAALKKLGIAGEADLAQVHVSDLVPSMALPTTLAPGTYTVGQVGHSSHPFFAEATVSEVSGSKRGELAQVLLLHDVSERTRTLNAIQLSETAANRASESKSQLLAHVSREVKASIRTIARELDAVAVARWLPPHDAHRADRVQRAVRYIGDLLACLDDLMADDLPACADAERRCGVGSLRGILDAAVGACRGRVNEHDLRVRQWVAPDHDAAAAPVIDGCTCLLRRVVDLAVSIAVHSACPRSTVDVEIGVSTATSSVWFHCRGTVCTPYARIDLFGGTPEPAPRLLDGGPAHNHGSAAPRTGPDARIDRLLGNTLSLALTVIGALLRPVGGAVDQFRHPERSGLDFRLPIPPPRDWARARRASAQSDQPSRRSKHRRRTTTTSFAVQDKMPEVAPAAEGHEFHVAIDVHDEEDDEEEPRMPRSRASASAASGLDGVQLLRDPPPELSAPRSPSVVAQQPVPDAGRTAARTPVPSSPLAQRPAPRPSSPLAPRTVPVPSSPLATRTAPMPSSPLAPRTAARTSVPSSPLLGGRFPKPPPALIRRVSRADLVPPASRTAEPYLPAARRVSSAAMLPRVASPVAPSATHAAPETFVPPEPEPAARDMPCTPPPPPALSVPTTPSAPAVPYPTAPGTPTTQFADSPTQPSTPVAQLAALPTVPSKPAVTTTATVASPIVAFDAVPPPASTTTTPLPPPPSPSSLPAQPKKRVLVVEDNALVQRVTRKLVEGLGFTADSALDGLQAVAQVTGPDRKQFDLVLMDLVMPNMGGHEAMAAIRAAGFGLAELPIVAVTANALPEERERCLASGFNVFLTKPLKKETLRELLRTVFHTNLRPDRSGYADDIRLPLVAPPQPPPLPSESEPLSGQDHSQTNRSGQTWARSGTRDRADLKGFAESRWRYAWRYRRGVLAALVALLVLLVGIAIATMLFVWFRSVERKYAAAEVKRRCGSLADSLKLDLNTNLNTFLVDYAGFMSAVGIMTNESLVTYGSATGNQSDRLSAIQLGPLLSNPQVKLFERRYNISVVRPPEFSSFYLSAPVLLRHKIIPCHQFSFPVGFDMEVPVEFASAISATLVSGRPALSLQSSRDSMIPHPSKRFFLYLVVRDVADEFRTWIMVATVNSQAILASNLGPAATKGLAVDLSDQGTGKLIYSTNTTRGTVGRPYALEVEIIDRVWVLSCTGTGKQRASFATPWPFLLLFVILALFLVLAEIMRRGFLRFLKARHVAHRLQQQAELVTAIRTYSTGILRTVRDPLLVLDGLGYIIGLNAAALDKLGLSGVDLAQVHVSDVVPSATDLTALEPGTYEIGQIGHPDRAFFAEATVSEVTSSKRGELAQVLLLHDVSDRTRMLEAIQVAESAAVRASTSKSQLLRFVCRELAETTAKITAALDAARPRMPPATADRAARIHRGMGYTADLVANLVDLMDSGDALACRDPAQCGGGAGPTTLRAILDDAIRACADRMAARDIQVQTWVIPDEADSVVVDFGPCTCVLRRVVAKATVIAIYSACSRSTVNIELVYAPPPARTLWFHCRGPVCTPYARLDLLERGDVSGSGSLHHDDACSFRTVQSQSGDHLIRLLGNALSLELTVIDALLQPLGGSVARFEHPKRGGLDMNVPLPPVCGPAVLQRAPRTAETRANHCSSTVSNDRSVHIDVAPAAEPMMSHPSSQRCGTFTEEPLADEIQQPSTSRPSSPPTSPAAPTPVPSDATLDLALHAPLPPSIASSVRSSRSVRPCPPPPVIGPAAAATCAAPVSDASLEVALRVPLLPSVAPSIRSIPAAVQVASTVPEIASLPPAAPPTHVRAASLTTASVSAATGAASTSVAAAAVEPLQPPSSPPAQPKKRVLVVEDNALVQRVTRKLVEGMGFEADSALDGLQAVAQVTGPERKKFDLVLMDLVMPNMGGHEAMAAIRAAGYTIPIVAVTANALPEERERCLAAGFDVFLTKPLKKDTLREVCTELGLM
ncbi:hypothetical protein H9P43_008896 [Blastocladiella emersonii ATCC 22665]|nr:hypothetical protein H9P43_008896 [Blastocladiella emersonii ATCC 22665]